MKKIGLLFIILVGIISFYSCEKDEERAVVGMYEPAVIKTPPSGFDYILLEQEATDTMTVLTWETADFGFPAAVSYTLQMVQLEKSFSESKNLLTTNKLSAALVVGDVNALLLQLKATPDFPADIKVRVKCLIHASVKTVYSDSIVMTLTPYPASLIAPPVYMLGDGTRAGWNNTKAVEMTYIGDDKYFLVDSLWSGKQVKFIAELGKWAPQWGTDATGTWSSGPLSYRPTESVPDPPSIPSPPTDGVYKIVFDKANMTYSISPSGLYLLGDATTAGWDNNAPLPMSLSGPNKFEITTNLTASKNYKFIVSIGAWAPQYGTNASGTADGGKLVYRPTEADPDPSSIPSPAIAGAYKIEADIGALEYTCTGVK